MSLDIYLTAVRPTEVYQANITHNLGKMASEAGLYQPLWRPEEIEGLGIGIEFAAFRLVPHLKSGLERLRADAERLRKLNPSNGWGSYDGLVKFVEKYIEACEANPDAKVSVSR